MPETLRGPLERFGSGRRDDAVDHAAREAQSCSRCARSVAGRRDCANCSSSACAACRRCLPCCRSRDRERRCAARVGECRAKSTPIVAHAGASGCGDSRAGCLLSSASRSPVAGLTAIALLASPCWSPLALADRRSRRALRRAASVRAARRAARRPRRIRTSFAVALGARGKADPGDQSASATDLLRRLTPTMPQRVIAASPSPRRCTAPGAHGGTRRVRGEPFRGASASDRRPGMRDGSPATTATLRCDRRCHRDLAVRGPVASCVAWLPVSCVHAA